MGQDATTRHETPDTTSFLVWFTGLLEPRVTAQILKINGDGFDTVPFLLKEWQKICDSWDHHYIVEAQSREDALEIVRMSRRVLMSEIRRIDGVEITVFVRPNSEVAA